MLTAATKIKLNDGNEIPQLGLGVFLSKAGGETARAVSTALECGFRHIDTAAIYGNEEDVGSAIAASGIKREDIFLTTKLWNEDIRQGKVREALETSLKKLKTDYVDLYLIHWPAKGFEKAYLEMLKLQKEGLIKSVGVSNFNPHHLQELSLVSDVIPTVNQIECHPLLQQNELIDYCRKLNIAVESWSPLGGARSKGSLLDDKTISFIAHKHNKTAAQVIIRWHLQRGLIVIPKSVHANRIRDNFDVFDFELDASDLNAIAKLNANQRFGSDPETFDF